MHKLAGGGTDPTAWMTILACRAGGFSDLDHFALPANLTTTTQAVSAPACATRLLQALCKQPLEDYGYQPDREQVRLGRSAFLLSELPLGQFYQQRYGAALINFSSAALIKLLQEEVRGSGGIPLQDIDSIVPIESQYTVTLTTDASPVNWIEALDVIEYEADLAEAPSNPHANVTWLGKGQYIYQWSSREACHFRLITSPQRPFDPTEWHASLAPAIETAMIQPAKVATSGVRRHFVEGRRVYLGRDAHRPNPGLLYGDLLGLEDAWVVSRMLENYEEAIDEGLASFQRFRQVRARRVEREAQKALRSLLEEAPSRRAGYALSVILGSRFLPEIAMQSRDWFHQHDCIRGFR